MIRRAVIFSAIIWGTCVTSGVLFGFNTGMPSRDYNACVISLSVVCLVWFTLFIHERKLKLRAVILFIVPILLIMYVLALISLASRTAFLTSIIGITYLFVNRIECDRRKPGKAIALFLVLLAVVGMLLYLIRPDSANGRLLIWRICISMLTDSPSAFLFGYGLNGFAKYYMPAQADYFSAHPSCTLAYLADDVLTPYNELLHLAITFGLLGVIVVSVIIFSIFCIKETCFEDVGLKSIIISFAVFSCFSFPLSSLPLCLFIIISLLSMRKGFLPKVLNLALFTILIAVSVGFGLEHFCRTRIDNSFKCSGRESSSEKQVISNRIYMISKHFPDNMRLLVYTSYYHRELEICGDGLLYPIAVNDAVCRIPSTRTYCMYAESLMSQKRYEEASEVYREATEMVPLKLAPRLGVLQCLIAQSETEAALKAAEQIISVPTKIQSRRSIEITKYARHVADSLNHVIMEPSPVQ